MSDTPPPPPPLPFGDPTAIDQANSRAVRKGVAFGCGGCALCVIVGLLFITGTVLLIMTIIRNDDTCVQTLRKAQASEVLKKELGEPMHMGWFVSGSISTSNGQGSTDVVVPIVGPTGEASVHTVGTKDGGAPWVYSQMEATIEKTGKKVDLR